MNALLLEYLPILIFLGIAAGLGLVFILAAFVLAPSDPDPEKVSAYECGFNAFDDARMKFDVRFYLVSILFIIFDLEIAFLFPWAVAFRTWGITAFWSMMVVPGRSDRRLSPMSGRRGRWNGSDDRERRAPPRRTRRRITDAKGVLTASDQLADKGFPCSPPPTTSSPGRAPARCTG
jgi:NADH-quinone oxidoreductase subunit A